MPHLHIWLKLHLRLSDVAFKAPKISLGYTMFKSRLGDRQSLLRFLVVLSVSERHARVISSSPSNLKLSRSARKSEARYRYCGISEFPVKFQNSPETYITVTCISTCLPIYHLQIILPLGKFVPVLNWLSITPWRRMGEWMYRSTYSWLVRDGQLHNPVALLAVPTEWEAGWAPKPIRMTMRERKNLTHIG
jgi:hypothetical protein